MEQNVRIPQPYFCNPYKLYSSPRLMLQAYDINFNFPPLVGLKNRLFTQHKFVTGL